MTRDEELPILRAFYDFILWLSPKIAKFPRDQRFVLGERMERQLHAILENLIRARYTPARRGILEQVNLDLEILRFQIRLAKDLRCLPIQGYGLAAGHITDIGRQVGGWLRQCKG
ncbi:MAG: diversity-generating retroelement protein Avd [Thermoguttaceae bacterium]